MERITYFERYRVSVNEDGTPRELSRHGAAVTYKAVDLQSGDPVALKVIPLSAVDPTAREEFEQRARTVQHVEHANVAPLRAFVVDADSYILASEYPSGDSVASWVSTQGPFAVDATLRVGLQVVSALQAAAFHALTHAAIEPSNIVIVPGTTTDGAWPSIKLTNLDTAGLRFVDSAAQLPAPQFASPEQLRGQPVDFPSEIYSLGATLCFMLTGRAPLGVTPTEDGGEAKLPANLRRLPRNVRDLLLDMLRPLAAERPQDPVAFAERLREVLASIERRRSGRKIVAAIGPAGAAVLQDRRRVAWPIRPLAIAAGAVALAAIAALVIAQPIKSLLHKRSNVAEIGVPVGIPQPQAAAVATNQTPPQPVAAASVPAATPTAPIAAASPLEQRVEPPPTDLAPERKASEDTERVAANSEKNEPAAPAEGPAASDQHPVQKPRHATAKTRESNDRIASNETARDDVQEQPATNTSGEVTTPSTTTTKRRIVARNSDEEQATDDTAQQDQVAPRTLRGGMQRARFVGTTPDGEWIFEAPSGPAIADLPQDPDSARSSHRRRHRVRQPADVAPDEPHTVLPALPPDD